MRRECEMMAKDGNDRKIQRAEEAIFSKICTRCFPTGIESPPGSKTRRKGKLGAHRTYRRNQKKQLQLDAKR